MNALLFLSAAIKPLRTLLLALLALPLAAQTYTPKEIVIAGPVDKTEALRLADLTPGSLTKEQIEGALGRLADTGMYADLSYTVNSNALTIVLKPSAAGQVQPVVFANFVWWKAGELEPLVEARVTGYHGRLPAAGIMTTQVEAALVALLTEKGVPGARVEAREFGTSAVILSLSSPSVTIATLTLQDSLPAMSNHVSGFAATQQGQDFDAGEATQTIDDSVNDMYRNAGYLDVATTPATYSAPQKTASGFAVGVTATVAPGERYTVAAMNVTPAPPATVEAVLHAQAIKVGDPASPAALRLAKVQMEHVYADAALYDARATIETSKDTAAHTVTYNVTFDPGQPYHFAQLNDSALTQQQQAAIAKTFHPEPRALADKALATALHQAMYEAHVGAALLGVQPNPASHTVTYIVKPGSERP
jgi:outer membrane protein assembly factor BamA